MIPDLAFNVDEIGIASGRFHELRLKSCYQPIYRIAGDRLEPFAVEALAIAFSEGRVVPARSVFARARQDEREALERLCMVLHMRNYHNIGVDGLELYFNAAPDTPASGVEYLEWLLAENDIEPAAVVCEITEAAGDAGALVGLARGLRAIGVRIAVDDFGAGHSQPERVRLLEPDVIKIDAGWFRAAAAEPRALALLPALFRRLRDGGASVLVEGIENPDLLEAAIEARADFLQGFLLARPALAGTIFDEGARSVAGLQALADAAKASAGSV